jgi:predicted DNA binding CopG/RHH family protein
LEKGEESSFAESQALDDVNLAALADSLLERIKIAANKRNVPYQPLIKTWLAEKLDAKS